MGTLHINELRIATHIGVHDWEQAIEQTLLIDIMIPLDIKKCEDKLENTIDYDALCSTVTEWVQNQRFKLIETVAESVAQLIQDKFAVEYVTVFVSKPHAIKNAKDVRIMINK